VPNGAVLEQDQDYMVRVLLDEKTGIFEQRPVKIGLQSRSLTEILSGLQEGEKVLVEKVSTPTRQLHIGG
jgi:multidrug efflux pump subunit AcrA (membrane-fusion protein)